MIEDDPWLDAGVEAEDDAPALRPRYSWFEYAGLDPQGGRKGSDPEKAALYGRTSPRPTRKPA